MRLPLFTLMLGIPTALAGQARPNSLALGLDFSAYPAGIISAARVTIPINPTWSVEGTFGLNFTDRGDFGEHDDEEGDGPGIGVGLRWVEHGTSGWFLGARAEVWWLNIEWRDEPGRMGQTDVTVLQPTLRGGRAWSIRAGRVRLEAGVALGVEVNMATAGEPVGEGAILLGGLSLLYRF